MIIEIRKAGFVNKGAELMLHAVIERLRSRYPDCKLAMAPMYGAADDTFERMRRLNLYPRASIMHKGVDIAAVAGFMPKSWRKAYGLITIDEVDVVIDIAGFAYSDVWGNSPCRELSYLSEKWKNNGTKFIMLPQALGPFQNVKSKYVHKWARNADLIFPRDRDSYNYLTSLVGSQRKIVQYPDFTNLVSGVLPVNYDPSDKRVAIVPNYRMVERNEVEMGKKYLTFLIKISRYLLEKGQSPFILVHEGADDEAIAQKVSDAIGGISIVKENDPLAIKGILGSCNATIGSRFHGLVSALSQGVPSLATGWSHKYTRLFEDYGFNAGLISVTDDDESVFDAIDNVVDPSLSLRLRTSIAERSLELKALSEDMWCRVHEIIES